MINYYEQGTEFLKQHNLNLAIEAFQLAIDENPEDIQSLIGLAQAHYYSNEFDKSLYHLKYAIDLIPDNKQVREFYIQVEQLVESSKLSGKMNRNKLISLSMIVKNEEDCLAECLESVKDVVDEIIICDTGSKDNTLIIAQQYNAIITHFVWVDDFAAARNHSLQQCKGEWILYLDADEVLTPQSASILRKLCSESNGNVGAFICDVVSKHYNEDEEIVDFIGKYPRLFRNIGFPKVKFFGKIHEQISPSIIENGYKVLPSELKIIHNGYAIPKDQMELKVRKNLNILLSHVNIDPTNGYAWYQLGNTLAQMKIYDQAKNSLVNAIKCGNLSDFLICNTSLQIADIESKEKNYIETIKWCELALQIMPNYIPALHLNAQAHLIIGNGLEAKRLFELILEYKDNADIVGIDFKSIEHLILTGLNSAKKLIAK